jgi:nucleotide-binding universal stress UspA family protein
VKVLLATDASDPALRACRYLVSLLQPDRDGVRLLTVLSYSLSPYSGIPDEPLADEAERERHVVEEVHRITDGPRDMLKDADIYTDMIHRFGNVTEQILGEINEWEPDLVVLGRRGVHGVERLIGSVSEHVLHHSKVPILLVP